MEYLDRVLQGDCIAVLNQLPEKSINTVVFSPPYWGLRKYFACECASRVSGLKDMERYKESGSSLSFRTHEPDPNCPKCHGSGIKPGSDGEIGRESTWHKYIENMVDVFYAMKRVLRDDGSIFLVIGDTFMGGHQTKGRPKDWEDLHSGRVEIYNSEAPTASSVGHCVVCQRKNKVLLPHRLAIALQDAGWIVRADIPWIKKNRMPTSAMDKWTPAHEYIFHITKNERYYFNMEEILVPAKSKPPKKKVEEGKQSTLTGMENKLGEEYLGVFAATNPEEFNSPRARMLRKGYDPDKFYSKKEGSDQPMAHPVDVFFTDWVPDEPMLEWDQNSFITNTARYPKDLCTTCHTLEKGLVIGEGRKRAKICPTCKNPLVHHHAAYPEDICIDPIKATCPTEEGVVLDPMAGTGTTLCVAKRLKKHYIGIELNGESVEFARLRLTEIP